MTVKVGEALYEMKEKLAKTERKVREVMKEKDRLEKMLEMKLKLIKVCSVGVLISVSIINIVCALYMYNNIILVVCGIFDIIYAHVHCIESTYCV